jgi:hypothetical protein
MGTERPGFNPNAAPAATELARTGGKVERARPEEVDNAIAAGINTLLVNMPELVRRGDVSRLKDIEHDIEAGVQLAEACGMILEPNECIAEVQREVARQVPEGIRALVEKGKTAVIYGQPTLVHRYREQLLMLLGHETNNKEPGENALVSGEESKANFERGVREGLAEAPDRYLDDVLGKLEIGITDAAYLMLHKVGELEKISKEFGVPFDRADFERSFNNILRKTAPIAIDKAILDIRNKVKFGALDIVGYLEKNILKYMDLLTARGVQRPITNEDLYERVEEQRRAGLNDGIEQIIQSIGQAIRLGFPENVALHQKKLDAYLASAAKAGVSSKPASEYAGEVEVVIRTEISDGIQRIVDSLEADLRRGRFKKDMVREAHNKVDQMVVLAKKVGVKIEAADFHDKIDHLVESIKPVA